MKKALLFFFALIGFSLTGQNLVLNPSFEKHEDERCIIFLGGFNKSISDWSIPNFGSTDFFDTCSTDMGSKNYNGFQEPKSGNSYAGTYFYTEKNYREYVQGQLSETLIEGKKYKMCFYLSLSDKSSYALKDIQVLITNERLKPCNNSNSCEKAIKPSKATNKEFKIYSNSVEKYFIDKQSWMEYTFEFTAEGYENYFSIGNFFRNLKTKTQRTISNSPYLFSYYYIDDVSIELLEKETPESVIEIPKKLVATTPVIETNEVYTFKNVLFDFDKAELLVVSIEELNDLYRHLSDNKNLNIEIYGHTDNIGLDNRNKELSEQRAKAVADYLILQGLKTHRIQSFGFGSSKPVSDNKTETGRKQNRRVAFKLIKN